MTELRDFQHIRIITENNFKAFYKLSGVPPNSHVEVLSVNVILFKEVIKVICGQKG